MRNPSDSGSRWGLTSQPSLIYFSFSARISIFSANDKKENQNHRITNIIHHLAFNGFIFTFSELLWHLHITWFVVVLTFRSFFPLFVIHFDNVNFYLRKTYLFKMEFIRSNCRCQWPRTKHYSMQTIWGKEIKKNVTFSWQPVRVCEYA